MAIYENNLMQKRQINNLQKYVLKKIEFIQQLTNFDQENEFAVSQ